VKYDLAFSIQLKRIGHCLVIDKKIWLAILSYELIITMGLRTYLKEKKNIAVSKCIHFQERFSSNFCHLQNKALSRFHCQKRKEQENLLETSKEVSPEDQVIGFVLQEDLTLEHKVAIAGELAKSEETFGRIQSLPEGVQIVKVIVRKGEIIEKVYLTPEGEMLSINSGL